MSPLPAAPARPQTLLTTNSPLDSGHSIGVLSSITDYPHYRAPVKQIGNKLTIKAPVSPSSHYCRQLQGPARSARLGGGKVCGGRFFIAVTTLPSPFMTRGEETASATHSPAPPDSTRQDHQRQMFVNLSPGMPCPPSAGSGGGRRPGLGERDGQRSRNKEGRT